MWKVFAMKDSESNGDFRSLSKGADLGREDSTASDILIFLTKGRRTDCVTTLYPQNRQKQSFIFD